MTKDQCDELVQALADYQFHRKRYRNVIEAMDDYRIAEAQLRRLIGLHAPGLVARASEICSCCGCTRRSVVGTAFVCGCDGFSISGAPGDPCGKHRDP